LSDFRDASQQEDAEQEAAREERSDEEAIRRFEEEA